MATQSLFVLGTHPGLVTPSGRHDHHRYTAAILGRRSRQARRQELTSRWLRTLPIRPNAWELQANSVN